MPEWIYIKKGDRRPVGDVLVARLRERDTPEARLKAAIFGIEDGGPPEPVVTIAHWHKGQKRWQHGPRGEEVRNVYAWAELPEAPKIKPLV